MSVQKNKNDGVAEITGVQFGVYTPEEVEVLSKCVVNNTTISRGGKVFSNGVNDSRLGTCVNKMLCSTCGQDINTCPGHIGHIKLTVPVLNAMFFKQIFKILSSVCFFCSRLLCKSRVLAEVEKLPLGDRLTVLFEKSKPQRQCSHCGEVQPGWKKLHNTMVVPIFTKEQAEVIVHVGPERLVTVLRHIRKKDIPLLGMNPLHSQPYALYWQNMIVPPVLMRPSRSRQSNLKVCCEDELTLKLRNIVKVNNQLGQLLQNTQDETTTTVNFLNPLFQQKFKSYVVKSNTKCASSVYILLQRFVSAFADSKFQPPSYDEYGGNRMSIKERIVGRKPKESRLRYNVFGKRQNISARTVITPCSDIQVNEIGVPKSVCMILTFPERVNVWNEHELLEKVRRGPRYFPGANQITRQIPSGETVTTDLSQLSYIQRANIKLLPGDVVRRHLVDGDWVLMNRQPSLHRLSVMSHRIKILPGKSFRLHLACTKSYNADFDGDEMNMMPAQSYQSKAEMQELLSVGNNVLKDGVVWVSFQQHSPAAAYLLTLATTRINEQWVAILLNEYPATNLPQHAVSGRQVFSYTLPEDFSIDTPSLQIRNGVLHSTLTKKTLNAILLKHYAQCHTSDETVRFISSLQRLLETFLRLYGLTLSPRDFVCSLPKEVVRKIVNATEKITAKHDHVVTHDKRTHELYRGRERNIISALNEVRQIEGSKVLRQLRYNNVDRNGMIEMVESGSKGDFINIIQNTAMVGQQLDHLGRRLVTRPCGDPNKLEESGFINNSYLSGMSPLEYFNHLRAARVGLVDTAVKTGETGYTARRLCKLLESVVITRGFDGQPVVTDGKENIIQFRYAYDNLDNDTLTAYAFPVDFDQPKAKFITSLFHPVPRPVNNIEQLRKWAQVDPLRFPLQIWRCGPLHGKILMPFDLQQLVTQHQKKDTPWDIPVYRDDVEDVVLDFIAKLRLPTAGLRCFFLFHLSPWRIPTTKYAMVKLLRHIRTRWDRYQVSIGDAIGIRAGQNCAHPMTQLALNTFHHSGEASNLVSGVALIKDVVNVLKNPAGPQCSVEIPEEQDGITFGKSLVGGTLKRLIKSWEVRSDGFTLFTESPIVLEEVKKRFQKVHDSSGKIDVELLEKELSAGQVKLHKKKRVVKTQRYSPKMNILNIITELTEIVYGIPEFGDFYVDGSRLVLQGSDLQEIMQLLPEHLRYTCRSNHIRQIASTLGIDAARNTIIRELSNILSASPVSIRHIYLLASVITYTGSLHGATQPGIEHLSNSVIQKASFEKNVSMILGGAIRGDKDYNQSSSESIMWNTNIKSGTGSVELNRAGGAPTECTHTHPGYREVKHVCKPEHFFNKRLYLKKKAAEKKKTYSTTTKLRPRVTSEPKHNKNEQQQQQQPKTRQHFYKTQNGCFYISM